MTIELNFSAFILRVLFIYVFDLLFIDVWPSDTVVTGHVWFFNWITYPAGS